MLLSFVILFNLFKVTSSFILFFNSLLILSSHWMITYTHCTNASAAKSGSGVTIDNFIADHNGCTASCHDDDNGSNICSNICTYTTKVNLFASEFGVYYFEECGEGTTTCSSEGSASSNTMPTITIAMEVSENIIVYCYTTTIVGHVM